MGAFILERVEEDFPPPVFCRREEHAMQFGGGGINGPGSGGGVC